MNTDNNKKPAAPDFDKIFTHGGHQGEEELVLLKDQTRYLVPALAVCLGGVNLSLLFSQICFWCERTKIRHEGKPVARFSYSEWQRQFPWLSTRWVKEMVSRLEQTDVIFVVRQGRKNMIGVNHADKKHPVKITDMVGYVVQPKLIQAVGLEEAILLQQVHIRTIHHALEEGYTGKSITDWERTFPFWCRETIKRTFRKLKAQGLLLARREDVVNAWRGEGDRTEQDSGAEFWCLGYRVNYIKLAKLVGLVNLRNMEWVNSSYTALDTGVHQHGNYSSPILDTGVHQGGNWSLPPSVEDTQMSKGYLDDPAIFQIAKPSGELHSP